ncbi:MAG: hypothetical protein EXQ52_14610 [Bryobacterales bacterium]|nr:hypothetical protein [Bryobacterales bacterium]
MRPFQGCPARSSALAIEGGPVVFAESSDSTGYGSPGVGELIPLLAAQRSAKLNVPAFIFLVDPEAAARAVEAGIGATVSIRSPL